jgi:hypothetical protein
MFKKLIKITLALLIVFAIAVPSHAAPRDYWAKVYAWDGSMTAKGNAVLTERNTGITFVVMMTDSAATLETLTYYDDQSMTSLANPVSATNFADDAICNDMVAFRTDPTATGDLLVDLIVVDQVGGYTAFVEDFSINTHTIVIDERPNVEHHGVAFLVTTGSSSEIDTGIDFEDDSIIHKMMIEVGTAFSGGAGSAWVNVGILSSGTNGDADGFIYMEELATAGYHDPFRPGPGISSYAVSSGGERACLAPAAGGTLTAGTFLGNFSIGTSDTALANSGEGIIHREQLMIHGSWENSLTYTFATSEAATGWGLVHFWFTRIR